MNTTRSVASYLFAAALSLNFISSASAQSVHFVAMGDTGSGLQPEKDVAEALAKYAEANHEKDPVKFVMLLGDNFYDNGVKTVDDAQWDSKFEKIYNPIRLSMPFLVVLGNHDWRGDHPEVEIAYTTAHPGTRWQMDAHWFKRQFADTNGRPLLDLFLIDTEAWNETNSHVARLKDEHLAERQTEWLTSELKNSKAIWKIVAAHHPLYSNGEHGHDKQLLGLRQMLGPLFETYKVDAYITGHDHDQERIEVPEHHTLFLISGGGAKLRPQKYHDWRPFFESQLGFLSIHITPTEMRGDFYNTNHVVMDTWHKKPSK